MTQAGGLFMGGTWRDGAAQIANRNGLWTRLLARRAAEISTRVETAAIGAGAPQ